MKIIPAWHAWIVACVSLLWAATQGAIFAFPPELPTLSQSDASLTKTLDEWRQARFGFFVHWGLYSIPGGEWHRHPVLGTGEMIMQREKIPVGEYLKLTNQFNPTKFSAEEWVRLARDAGMRYIIVTAKHFDGFAMYHSKVSRYNIVDATPFGRDPLKELAEACAKNKMKFGFFYSHCMDLNETNGVGNDWDFDAEEKKDFEQYLRDKVEPQLRELLSNYGPVSVIWFDSPRKMTVQRTQRLINLVHSLQPGCLVNSRVGLEGGDFMSTRNRMPALPIPGDWECPLSLNHTWGYMKTDQDWKSPEEVIFLLVDATSKGGNFLLNVGAMPEGNFPEEATATLRRAGQWLAVNGESIYGAGLTPFGAELGQLQGKVVHTAKQWRCTSKPGRLFFHLFEWPDAYFALPPKAPAVKKAWFLMDKKQTPLNFARHEDVTVIDLPQKPPDPIDSVLVVEVDSK